MSITSDVDVVIVGGGLSGLSAGALLSKAGLAVAVVERNEKAGGCAQSFNRGGFTIDPAVHVTLEARSGAYINLLLDHLDVEDLVTFEKFDEVYHASFPDLDFVAPTGREDFLATYQDLFPTERNGLARLMDMRADLYEQTSSMPQQIDPRRIEETMAQAPLVLQYRMSTVEDVLGEYIEDPRCRAAMAAIWPYLGSSPSRLSFLLFNQMLETFHGGGYYPRGSFQSLVDALVRSIERSGSQVILDEQVQSITVDSGRATGLRLADGRVINGRAVVSAVDANQTFAELVGWDRFPVSLRRRVERYSLAPSAVALYGSFDGSPGDVGLRDENLIFRHWDHERTWAELQDRRPGGIWASVPTLVDPSVAPAGQHLVAITGLVPAVADGSWAAAKPALTEDLLTAVEHAHPGFRDGFALIETATPDSLHRYTLNTGGTCYGWENIPAQTASKRLPHRSRLDGLYMCGHWTEEGESSLRALTSGRAVARIVAEDLGLEVDAVPDFGGPSLLRGSR